MIATAVVTSAGIADADVIEFGFEIDAYGLTSEGAETGMGSGAYGVVDLWATTTSDEVRLLNLFDVQVSIDRGSFLHNDASDSGHWNASFTKQIFGMDAAVDSFVTMGEFVDGDPFAVALDPNFDGTVGGEVTDLAGWYNPDPFNEQGVPIESRIFIGRFVFDQADVAGNTFSLSGSLGWKLDEPGSIVQQSSDVVSRTFPSQVVPGPVVGSILGGLMLVRRRRR